MPSCDLYIRSSNPKFQQSGAALLPGQGRGSINLTTRKHFFWCQKSQNSTAAGRPACDKSNVTEPAAPPQSNFAIFGTKKMFASPLILIQYYGPLGGGGHPKRGSRGRSPRRGSGGRAPSLMGGLGGFSPPA